jgi:hypothetical protein
VARRKSNGQLAKRKAAQPLLPEPYDFESAVEQAEEDHVQALIRAHTPRAIRALVEIATGEKLLDDLDENGCFQVDCDAGGAIRLEYSAGPRVTAAKAILEQHVGRPVAQPKAGPAQPGAGLTIIINELRTGKQREIDVSGGHLEIGPGED